jgi:hypothetical protein
LRFRARLRAAAGRRAGGRRTDLLTSSLFSMLALLPCRRFPGHSSHLTPHLHPA